jgi:hypothetical protein
VAELKPLAIRPETQRLDFARPFQALAQQIVFQGQIVLLKGIRIL